MQRKQNSLVPIGDALADLDGPVKAIREASPQARHHFTRADQVNQLVGASEADPNLGFMARTMALCSLPRSNPGNRTQYKRVNGPYTLIMSATGVHKGNYILDAQRCGEASALCVKYIIPMFCGHFVASIAPEAPAGRSHRALPVSLVLELVNTITYVGAPLGVVQGAPATDSPGGLSSSAQRGNTPNAAPSLWDRAILGAGQRWSSRARPPVLALRASTNAAPAPKIASVYVIVFTSSST